MRFVSAARDHWPPAGFVLFAGGGLKTGQLIGAADRRGQRPTTRPIGPQNVLARLYQFLNISRFSTTANRFGNCSNCYVVGAGAQLKYPDSEATFVLGAKRGVAIMHVEFVVLGPPISNQQSTPRGKANLTAWRATVLAEAQKAWTKPTLAGKLKAIIINFHKDEKPSVDVDNMSKPILDVIQETVYDDDRQIRQAEFIHVRIDSPFVFVGVSKMIATAIQAGIEFVYVRIEDPADPYPLPK